MLCRTLKRHRQSIQITKKRKIVTKVTTNGRRKRGTGGQHVLDSLRLDILTLKLAPGESLDESSLSKRFGTSRSPVREALIHLSAEGLVVTSANRGTFVAPIDFETFPKHVEALDLLQRANTRLAAQLRTDEDIENIRQHITAFDQAIIENDYLEMSKTNRDFHLAIAHAGKNPYLTAQYGSLLNSGRRMLHLHFDYLKQDLKANMLTNEHPQMLQAIIDQDVEKAEQLAHNHTRQFRERFLQFMSRNLTADISITPEDYDKTP